MDISSLALQKTAAVSATTSGPAAGPELRSGQQPDDQTREAFRQFVGESFFGLMIKSMRKTVGKPAYMHGGFGEEIWQGQMDQTLAQNLAQETAPRLADPMYDLFTLGRPH